MQLRTERCVLRPFASSDRERLALIANDRSISRNLTDAFPYPYTLEDADDWIEATSRHDPPRHFAIEVGGELVGGAGVEPRSGEKQHVAGVGYWLAPTHWGHGFATEVLTGVVEYVFDAFPHINRLEASVYGWNTASGRVLEKCGFRKEATLRKAISKDGDVTDEHIYRLIRQEPEPVDAVGAPRGAVIRALHHVQLALPPGGEAEAEDFYDRILGIPRVAKPAHLEARGGCWFEDEHIKIHLGVENDFRPARKAHPALVVDDLNALRTVLEEAGVDVVVDQALPGFDRFYVSDPFGNRLEFLQTGPSPPEKG